MAPDCTCSRTLLKLWSNLRLNPICSFTPDCRTASTTERVCARSILTGFSQKICLPARAACSMSGTWVSVDEQISTASTSDMASSSPLSVVTTGMPRPAAQLSSSGPAYRSLMPTISACGLRSRLSAWILPILPAPIIPILTLSFVIRLSSCMRLDILQPFKERSF